MNDFRIPTRVRIAPGAAGDLPGIVSELGCPSVLLVTDPGVRGVSDQLATKLRDAGVATAVFDEVESNPRTTTAERIAGVARDRGDAAVVGVGGGSVLDAAKAAAMLSTNEGSALDFVGKNRFTERPLPFLAIPTTCGTGSEVTWVSVLTDASSLSKISIKGDAMFPAFALVDADLVAGLPGPLVASTGLDALTHAIEATTGLLANPTSDALAEKSIALTLRFLPRAVADIANDHEARVAVVQSATLAGMAFGNSDVGGVHCLSETIGGLIDAPHGLTNAMLLAPVLRYHLEHIEGRLAQIDTGAEHFIERIEALVSQLEIPAFATLAFSPEQLNDIAQRAARNGSNDSNPQPMAAADYLAILTKLS